MIDNQGKPTLPWILFFNQLFTGDTGQSWTPSFTSLTSTGTPTFAGKFYKISSELVYFTAVVTPATNTTATAGVTYINNPPVSINRDGACLAAAANLGGLSGMCVASSNRIYVPGWSAVTVPVTVSGLMEAS